MSKFVGTGPSSHKKRNLPGRGLTEAEKHWSKPHTSLGQFRDCYFLSVPAVKSSVRSSLHIQLHFFRMHFNILISNSALILQVVAFHNTPQHSACPP